MVKLMEEGYGTKKGIPQLILAGASVDDVYVIVLDILIGFLSGWMLSKYFEKVHIRDTIKILIILSWSFILVAIGEIPLSLGLGCGDIVLTVAVLAIVLTAPLGAFAIDLSYKKMLQRETLRHVS